MNPKTKGILKAGFKTAFKFIIDARYFIALVVIFKLTV